MFTGRLKEITDDDQKTFSHQSTVADRNEIHESKVPFESPRTSFSL